MNTNKKSARFAGILFVIATVAGVLSTGVFLSPILDASGYLVKVSAGENMVILGVLLMLLMAFSCAGIAISLYPVLRKYNEGLALGSVGFRIIEAVLVIVATGSLLSLLIVSREFVKAGASDASYFQTLGTVIRSAYEGVFNIGFMSFCLGALMYYYIFYQSKLIPRWLSGWGFIAAAMSLSVALLILFGEKSSSTIASVLNIPIFLQEMVFAVWLIVKGFNPSAAVYVSTAKPGNME